KWIGDKRDGETPLHFAARLGLWEAAQWLLTHGADPNAIGPNYFTPLHLTKKPQNVKLLIQKKTKLNLDSAIGTPLKNAARNASLCRQDPDCRKEAEQWSEIVSMLLKAGADYDIQSACELGDLDRVRLLQKDKELVQDDLLMVIAAGN